MLTPLANLAIIVVLVLFMLLNREDLRNRIVRLAGTRLTLTTRTLDEVGTRISRYLLASSLINGSFGLAVAAGLWLIGVHYALMWGFLAGVLRFVPYVGPMLGAAMPITMAFIQFPDWQHVAVTAGVFFVLELITNNIAEPLLFGRSAGVSTVALLVSVTFWTWIWGPMGLVLAVPLTVLMAVLGEHVPALQPLGILLGDKPPLASFVTYYQRLLANDVDEAASIVEEQHKSGGLIQVYDHVLIPALILAEKDREHGDLLPPTQEFIWQATREFIDDLTPQRNENEAGPASDEPARRARVLGVPAHDEADVMALRCWTSAPATGAAWKSFHRACWFRRPWPASRKIRRRRCASLRWGRSACGRRGACASGCGRLIRTCRLSPAAGVLRGSRSDGPESETPWGRPRGHHVGRSP